MFITYCKRSVADRKEVSILLLITASVERRPHLWWKTYRYMECGTVHFLLEISSLQKSLNDAKLHPILLLNYGQYIKKN